jgi:methionyl aminopeptidase
MITPKTASEISLMRQGGQKLGEILDALLVMSKPGVKLIDIEMQSQKLIAAAGGTPSFMTVGDYKWSTCLCINDEVVHGIPTARLLVAGDVLTIDIGMIFGGFHTDTAQSIVVGRDQAQIPESTDKFLQTGKKALEDAIAVAKAGNRVGHISEVIQHTVESAGYGIVKPLVGHGVGRTLHEDPQIPGFLRTDIRKTPELIEGMTIAIEVIYAAGNGSVVYANDDGWTISTRDGSLSAVFEHSVVITKGYPVVITRRPSEMKP